MMLKVRLSPRCEPSWVHAGKNQLLQQTKLSKIMTLPMVGFKKECSPLLLSKGEKATMFLLIDPWVKREQGIALHKIKKYMFLAYLINQQECLQV